ncbi:MAG: hypothetical protein ACR2M2_11200 [Gaiellaceae bacterium]
MLTTVGGARTELGDDVGITDLEESRRVAAAVGATFEAARACNNLGVLLYGEGELIHAFALLEEAARLAERAGHVDMVRFAQGMALLPALDHGRWDDCVRLADAFIAECEAGAGHTLQASVHCHRGSIRLARNETEGALADAERALELAVDVQQPDRVFQSLAFAVRAFTAAGGLERARELASEFDFFTLCGRRPPPAWSYIHFAWVATEVGSADELERLLAGQKRQTTWVVATRAVLGGDYVEAAELFARMGRARTRPTRGCAPERSSSRPVGAPRRTNSSRARSASSGRSGQRAICARPRRCFQHRSKSADK